MKRYLNKVFHGDALQLLRVVPTSSVDAVITDPMYGTSKKFFYEWGIDPARGDPVKHWLYHQPIYEECRRVLKPGGVLAWAQGAKFCEQFHSWFGDHRLWTLTRFRRKGMNATGHVWIVQTREQQPIEFPERDSLVTYDDLGLAMIRLHPCIKPPEESAFIIESVTQPGEIVLDCFCGLGGSLIAAKKLGRSWIGCDLSRTYCQVAMKRLAETQSDLVDCRSATAPVHAQGRPVRAALAISSCQRGSRTRKLVHHQKAQCLLGNRVLARASRAQANEPLPRPT